MKHLILVPLCFSLIACGNGSDTSVNNDVKAVNANMAEVLDEQKINTVREMYAQLQANSDILIILTEHGTAELLGASQLATLNSSTPEQMYNEGISMCDEAGWSLKLLPTQDLEVQDIVDVDYKVLTNGHVRASIITDVYSKDIDSQDFDIYKDYILDCDNKGCKVDDILDYAGVSAKSEIKKYCGKSA